MSLSSLGLIPCAGSANRFGGILKELLPIGGQTLLQKCLETLESMVDRIMVVSSEAKLSVLSSHLPEDALIVVQRDGRDLYGAMRCAFGLADKVVLSMPDTIWYQPPEIVGEFGTGTFLTKHPERFGCFAETGFVVDKNQDWEGTIRSAWGMFYWSKNVEAKWIREDAYVRNQTDAINLAIGSFNNHQQRIEGYHDFASWDDYREYIQAH